jgi:Ca2+-transporting ATPase
VTPETDTASDPVTAAPGLSSTEAAARLKRHGPNELPRAERHGIGHTLVEIASEPMLLLLLGCGVLYLFLGDVRDALTLLGFVGVLLGITFVQERRTERALQALRDLSSPRALAIRDGQRLRIAGRDVVPGDWIVLSEGDRVPADSILLDSHHMEIDESLLTGESAPVRKSTAAGRADTAPRTDGNAAHVYSGTLVVNGHGVARVEATGLQTQIGRIGHALRDIAPGRSPLRRETDLIVRRVAIFAVLASAAVTLLYGLARGLWTDGLLGGLALAMTLLPAEFPVTLTVFLALGAWRLSRLRVLARHMSAVETLGAVTLLCVDKTGTLTENRMRVGALVTADGTGYAVGREALPESAHRLVEYAILATRTDPFDPMERAIQALGFERLVDAEHLHGDWRMLREYPLSSDLMAMSHVWETRRDGSRCIAAKGAPEAIAELCHLDAARTAALAEDVQRLSEQGLRVIAVATARLTHSAADPTVRGTALPARQHDFVFELLGLLGLQDPVREAVPAAVAACRTAGIRVVMITGDHHGTACSVARQSGLPHPDRYVLGTELDALSDEALRERLRCVSVIARAHPEHKLRIVRALQADGEVVGMTGDGVNDAPALRAADIGVAMGGRGTDVAREAAGLVIADDDFGSIFQAVRMGRRIDHNLRRAMGYIIAVHIPIAGVSLVSALLGWPLLLLPAHIAFLELIIDPACSVVFEAGAEDPGALRRPPRPIDEPLFGRALLWRAVAQGGCALAAVLALVALIRHTGAATDDIRTIAFMMLVLGNLAMIVGAHWNERDLRAAIAATTKPLWLIVIAALLALITVLAVPGLRDLFRLASPHLQSWILCAATALLLTGLVAIINRAASDAPRS